MLNGDRTRALLNATLLAGVALIILAYLAGPVLASGGTHEPQDVGPVGVVYGCPLEDSCSIDYRADRLGRGVWVVKRGSVRLAKVYGCNAEDDCRIDYRVNHWTIIRVIH